MGILPNALLDLTYSQYVACIKGYKQVTKDQEVLAVMSGYYAAYFSKSKHPKSLQKVIDSIYAPKRQQQHMNTIDVEAFLKREKAFTEEYDKWQVQKQKQLNMK